MQPIDLYMNGKYDILYYNHILVSILNGFFFITKNLINFIGKLIKENRNISTS